jgi:hypothetical protein
MASTFIRYKGRSVHVPEDPLICVGCMLFHEGYLAAVSEQDKARIEQMNRDWLKRTTGVGCTDLALDIVLQGDPRREAEFLSFVDLARKRLLSFGATIPVDYVNRVIAIRDYKGQPLAVWPWDEKVLNVIEALIRGEPIRREWCL